MTPQPVALSKRLGGIFIIAGTAIGAGMLGIPFAVAALGAVKAIIVLAITWLLMLATAILITEVNCQSPTDADFDGMAKTTLGWGGQIINRAIYWLLLYALMTAYITAGGGLLMDYLIQPLTHYGSIWLGKILFTGILGLFVYLGTQVVDRVNKLFFIVKMLTFISLVLVGLAYIHADNLINQATGQWQYAWYAIPILITSFGFHIVIPALRTYFSNDRVLKQTVIVGGCIPMFVYAFWIIITLGVIPFSGGHSIVTLFAEGKDVGAGYQYHVGLSLGHWMIIMFEAVAVVTSFLGVSLALFHFNKETFSKERFKVVKLKYIFLITFIPSLLFALFFVKGFLNALGYASIFVALLLIILPALMAWRIRKRHNSLTMLGRIYLLGIIFAGMMVIALQLLTSFNCLPTLSNVVAQVNS